MNVYTSATVDAIWTVVCMLQLRSDSTCTGKRFRVSVKRTSPCDSAGATVQSTTRRRGVRVS
jgi:hypothetical protein